MFTARIHLKKHVKNNYCSFFILLSMAAAINDCSDNNTQHEASSGLDSGLRLVPGSFWSPDPRTLIFAPVLGPPFLRWSMIWLQN